MKTNRNDACPCGSDKKFKNCCEQKPFQSGDKNRLIRWLIRVGVGLFLAVIVWEVVVYFTTDHPEMEAYKCPNPNCTIIHYRQKTLDN